MINRYSKFRRDWSKHLSSVKRRRNYSIKKHYRKYSCYVNKQDPSSAIINDKYFHFFQKFHSRPAVPMRKGKKTMVNIPHNFCLIEYPEEALKAIKNSCLYYLDKKTKFVTINHTRSKNFNLTAEVLLAIAIQKSQQYIRLKGHKTRLNGVFPDNDDHRQLINEIGVVSEIKARATPKTPYSREKQQLFTRNSVNFQKPSASSKDEKSEASTSFANHVNECVKDLGLKLSTDAYQHLMKCVSEVIDNVERHSSALPNDYIWHMRGYLNNHSENKHFEISIFNFGMTIAETFTNLPEESYAHHSVKSYVDNFKSSVDPEVLYTIAALQHRVSCKNETDSDTNGQGTIVLIQFFEALYDAFVEKRWQTDRPKMSIVSGSTHILFDGSYRLKDIEKDKGDTDNERFVIAFNERNDLKLPPDRKYVRSMHECFFPGVAISIRFPLKQLKGITEYE